MIHLKTVTTVFLFFWLSVLTGCDDKPADTATSEVKAPASSASDEAKVTVSAEGTKFDPAIDKAQLPEGVWYCDMQTVHYASQSEGDGKCPVCGMKLKKLEGHPHDEHGHDEHGHDEHDHQH